MDDFDKIVRNDRQMKAIIWLNKEEFEFLLEAFSEVYKKIEIKQYEERKKENEKARTYWWRKWILNTNGKKLFFTLSYLKIYTTFDVLWYYFWLSKSAAHIDIHKYIPILKETFIALWVSPKREINNPEDFIKAFGKENIEEIIKELIIDATERRHFRHKDYEKQKENYSGKKNAIPKRIQS